MFLNIDLSSYNQYESMTVQFSYNFLSCKQYVPLQVCWVSF